MSKLSLFEKLSLSTIRIECELGDGSKSTGTGFFMKFCESKDGNKGLASIVTNKHVVKGAVKGRIYFTLSERKENYPAFGYNYYYDITEFENGWRKHPDPEIDLCAMPINTLAEKMIEQGMKPYVHFLERELIPTQEDIENMTGSEKITMIGYPNGLWDAKNNQPIFRSGSLATHYKFDWNDKSEFVIDAACFPGSSGSPVLLIDIGQVYSKKGLNIGSSRIKFLGVLYAGPVMSADGSITIKPTPANNIVTSRTNIPINLGFVIKSSNLLVFDEIFAEEMKN